MGAVVRALQSRAVGADVVLLLVSPPPSQKTGVQHKLHLNEARDRLVGASVDPSEPSPPFSWPPDPNGLG